MPGCGEQSPSLQTYRGDEKQPETVRGFKFSQESGKSHCFYSNAWGLKRRFEMFEDILCFLFMSIHPAAQVLLQRCGIVKGVRQRAVLHESSHVVHLGSESKGGSGSLVKLRRSHFRRDFTSSDGVHHFFGFAGIFRCFRHVNDPRIFRLLRHRQHIRDLAVLAPPPQHLPGCFGWPFSRTDFHMASRLLAVPFAFFPASRYLNSSGAESHFLCLDAP